MFVHVTFGVSLSVVVGGITLAGLLAVAQALAAIGAILTALYRLIEFLRARHDQGNDGRGRAAPTKRRRQARAMDWLNRAKIRLFLRKTTSAGRRENEWTYGGETHPASSAPGEITYRAVAALVRPKAIPG